MLHTDNDPLFASDELSQFLQHDCINLTSSPPHFPRSNGFIKCKVHTILLDLQSGPTCPHPRRSCTTGHSSAPVSHQHQRNGTCLQLPDIQMPVTGVGIPQSTWHQKARSPTAQPQSVVPVPYSRPVHTRHNPQKSYHSVQLHHTGQGQKIPKNKGAYQTHSLKHPNQGKTTSVANWKP